MSVTAIKFRLVIAAGLVSLWFAGGAIPSARGQSPPLIPKPRQVKYEPGRFVVTPKTRIVLTRTHAQRDRIAAEMLAEDIERMSGWRLKIRLARSLPHSRNIIYLGLPSEDKKLEKLLASKGLAIDSRLGDQGYAIDAEPTRVVVAARSGQGLFYGVQTLRQLFGPVSSGGYAFPAVTIDDWPAVEWRGVQDDISRGPIPTLEYLKRQIRTLSEYKINLLALYMETVFDYQSQPLVAPKGAALDSAEIQQLVDYARQYYVTIMPEQEAFGHLHKLLREEAYSDLAETPHGAVLTPANSQSFELIRQMLTELAPLFPGPFFHIGADETLELGEGRTKALAEKEGLGSVYLEFLKRIRLILLPYHKRILFWGDIAIHYPQLLGALPKDMIAVPWDYSARPRFDALLAPYRNAGLATFVSPGASNWNRIFPDFDTAAVNIRNFVRDGQKFGSLGTLNTTWNDDGESLLDTTWPALVFGAACSWQPGESSIDDFWSGYDWAFYRHGGHGFRDAIEELSHANTLLAPAGLPGAYNQLFWLDPFSPAGAAFAGKTIGAAHELRMDAEQALTTLYQEQPNVRLHASTIDDMIFAAQRLDALGMKIQYTAEIGASYWDAYQHMADHTRVTRDLARINAANGRLEDLRDSTTRLGDEYRRLWLRQYLPFWLGNVTVRYSNLSALFQAKIQAMDAVLQNYNATSILPSPVSLGFTFRLPAEDEGK